MHGAETRCFHPRAAALALAPSGAVATAAPGAPPPARPVGAADDEPLPPGARVHAVAIGCGGAPTALVLAMQLRAVGAALRHPAPGPTPELLTLAPSDKGLASKPSVTAPSGSGGASCGGGGGDDDVGALTCALERAVAAHCDDDESEAAETGERDDVGGGGGGGGGCAAPVVGVLIVCGAAQLGARDGFAPEALGRAQPRVGDGGGTPRGSVGARRDAGEHRRADRGCGEPRAAT